MNGRAGDVTLAIRDQDWRQLAEGLGRQDESAWVAWARLVEGVLPDSSRATLLVRDVMPVPDEAYEVRAADRLSIRSSGWVPGFGAAVSVQEIP